MARRSVRTAIAAAVAIWGVFGGVSEPARVSAQDASFGAPERMRPPLLRPGADGAEAPETAPSANVSPPPVFGPAPIAPAPIAATPLGPPPSVGADGPQADAGAAQGAGPDGPVLGSGPVLDISSAPRLEADATTGAFAVAPPPTPGVGDAPPPGPRPRAGAQLCMRPDETERALRVALVSIAPAQLCAAAYQVLEVRNDGVAPLRDVSLSFGPPLERGEMSFASPNIEISTDDGATWGPARAPRGVGDIDDPLVWTRREAQPLDRLSARGEAGDSVLFRWRAAFGEAFGEPFAQDPRLFLSAEGVDACGVVARAPLRAISAPLLTPTLIATVTGRNITRGGAFSRDVGAAPGDEIEWRVEIENIGGSTAREVRLRITNGDGAVPPLTRRDAGGFENGVAPISNVAAGGRRTVVFREVVGAAGERRVRRVDASWGCAAPPVGAAAALENPFGGAGQAVLLSAPSATELDVEQRILTGADRPGLGDAAEIRVIVSNRGAPAFDPIVSTALPAGFALDRSAPVTLFGRDAGVAGATAEPGPNGVRLTLLGVDDRQAVLNQGARVTLGFRIRRIAAAPIERDEASSAVAFVSAAGARGQTAAAATEVELRQARLEVALTPLDDPIVGIDGEARQFRIRVRNLGEEIARAPEIRISAELGWTQAPPPNCALQPPTNRSQSAICPLARDLRPGEAAELTTALTPSDDAGGLAVSVTAVSFGRESGGVAAELSRDEARAGAVGFSLEQQAYTLDGRPLPPDAQLQFGDRFYVELDARWFGLGSDEVRDAVLTQTLPPGLALVSADAARGELLLEAAQAAPGDDGAQRVLWSLAPFSEGGRFVGRAELRVSVRPGLSMAAAGPTAEAGVDLAGLGALDADAVFSVRGAAYGIDAQARAAAEARRLSLDIAAPDFSLAARWAPFSPDDPAAAIRALRPPPADAELSGGEQRLIELRLTNRGDAAGYMDWVAIDAPPFAVMRPPASDGLDNDDDGVVDEADEGEGVIFEIDDDGARLRWIARPNAGGAIGGDAQRLDRNETAIWRAAFEIAPDVGPDRRGALRLAAQVGAAPLGEPGGETRPRVERSIALVTPPIVGFLVIAATSVGQDLDATLRHGERVDHRLSLRFPSGAVENAVVTIGLPPALADTKLIGGRLAPGLRCDSVFSPTVETSQAHPGLERDSDEGEAISRVIIWRLGRCEAAPRAPERARTALLDFTSVVSDAPSGLTGEAQRDWRSSTVKASLVSTDRPTGALVGESALQLNGPILRAEFRVDVAEGDGPRAGDTVTGRLIIRNLGDAPARDLSIFLSPVAGLDCEGVSWELPLRLRAADALADAPSCGSRAIAPQGQLLDPGDRIELGFFARLSERAPLDDWIEAPLTLSAAHPDGQGALRIDAAPLRLRTAPPQPPLLLNAVSQPDAAGGAASGDAGSGDAGVKDAPAIAAIGDVFKLRAEFEPGEGQGELEAVVRVRLLGAAGPLMLDAAPLEVESAILRGLGGVFDAAAGNRNAPSERARNVARRLRISAGRDGWWEFRLSLGAMVVRRDSVDAAPKFALDLALGVADAPSARGGRLVEAQAALEVGSRAHRGDPQTLARLAEPFLELAALASDPMATSARAARRMRAAVCNRGDAPAYGAAVEVRLPTGVTLAAEPTPRYAIDPPSAQPLADPSAVRPRPWAARIIGEVAIEGGRVIARPFSSSEAVPAGACATLAFSVQGPALEGGEAAELRLLSYQSRPSPSRPGRVYRAARTTKMPLPPTLLTVETPQELAARAGDALTLPIRVRLAASGAQRLSVAVRARTAPDATGEAAATAPPNFPWRLHLDADGDGALGPQDPLWRDGDVMRGPVEFTLLASAPAFQARSGWRIPVIVDVVALGDDGVIRRRAAATTLRDAENRSARLKVRKTLAVDRDCDGRLDDEAIADAVFEPVKQAGPDECLHIRLGFANPTNDVLENVAVADLLPPHTVYVPGSAGVAVAAPGLLARTVREPTAAAPQTLFRFVGPLAPNVGGVVQYRVRIEPE